jgi:MFS family permease
MQHPDLQQTRPTAPAPDRVGAVGLTGWSVAATVAGNALEFYDFIAYSTFAVYIGRAFFPSGNGVTNLLLTLATFGVGFLTRPLGAVWIGAYADRAGRRPAMTLTIGLMAIGTLALVVTPTYASIGMAAPIILVAARLVQGLALGGEVGPATAVLLECAPLARRGAFVSWQGISQGAAVLSAGIVGFALSQLLGGETMADWGWRLPFAFGLCIIPFGLYIRRRLPETLEVRGTRGSGAVLRMLWETQRRTVVLAVLAIMALTISTYATNYMTTYALTALGMPASKAIFATIANGAAMMVAALCSGRLCDRFGRRWTMILPRVVLMLVVYPAFELLLGVKTPTVLVAVTMGLTLIGGLSGTAALTALTEALPNESRSSGMAVAYASAVTVFGGTAQFIIAWLIDVTGDRAAPAYYIMGTTATSVWAMFNLSASVTAASGREAAVV